MKSWDESRKMVKVSSWVCPICAHAIPVKDCEEEPPTCSACGGTLRGTSWNNQSDDWVNTRVVL